MKSKHFLLTPFALPALWPSTVGAAMPEHQRYDTSFQWYSEDDNRMQIESFYLRGDIEIDADNSFRFQYLRDSISGSSPTGALPGGSQPFLADIEDVRTGLMLALSHQFGDHRVEFEASRSEEGDYISNGFALSDQWDLNQKNTRLAFGINYLSDEVDVSGISPQDKTGLDLFTGITQIIDKNTVVTANLTLGNNSGYLNDPYKSIQRDDSSLYDLPPGTLINTYSENRPDERFRQVLQFQCTHYFESLNGALDAVLRLSHDDYGVFSQCIQVEWRESILDKFEVTPFVRYYNQNAADFFVNTLDGLIPTSVTPPDYPQGSAPNYSSDYRLSSLESFSMGLRLRYQINDNFSANASYERYIMNGRGSDVAPSASYPSADIWTIGLSSKF